jgi:capsular polysaccharide biosynthesis protein
VELRQYWDILVDRAPIVLVTFLVGFVVAAATVLAIPQTTAPYQAELMISVKPAASQISPSAPTYYPPDYYGYIASEYANDDLIWVVQTNEFMDSLRAQLQGRPGGAPSGTIKGEKAHRVVDLTITSNSASGAMVLAQTIASALTGPDAQQRYFSKFTDTIQSVSVVQPPQIVSQPAGRSIALNLAARSLVGLILGLGLAFLVEYLDSTLRPGEVEGLLGWPVLGEIPGRGLPNLSAPAKPVPVMREKLAE